MLAFIALLLVVTRASLATEYYVSFVDGSDSNPGTFREPWQHIQRAVTELKPGDICTIRGGTYKEQVYVNDLVGKLDQAITFRAYPSETVIFDGTRTIEGNWKRYRDSIYMLQLDYDIWQLFVDDEMQINARWPNAYWYDYSVFDYTRWGFSSQDSTYNLTDGTGIMIDNGTQNLAMSGINATGAVAILNIGQWLTWAGLVTKHKPGDDVFTYSLNPKPNAVHFVPKNCRYFLEDKLEFLDTPTEWYFDPTSKILYLWLKSSDNPTDHVIRGKVSTYAFTITNNSEWIILSGFNFFATTIYARGKSSVEDVSNIRLESCHFSYPSYSKRMLGSVAVPNTTTLFFNGDLTENAGNFSIFNCTFEYADGQTISYRGADGHFVNNLWHHNDFTCVGDGELFESEGVRDSFLRNIVHSNGPSVGFSPGIGRRTDRDLGLPVGSDIRLNIFYDLKYLQNDGAHVQTMVSAQNGTILEYNWCYDTMKWGLRFDRVDQNNASWGYNGTLRYNVVWKTSGIMIKGDQHHCYNNLAFDNYKQFDLCMFGYPGIGVKGENSHTITTSNILQHGACSTTKTTTGDCTFIPGHFQNNAIDDVRKTLRDPDNLDFRPIPGSDYITEGIGPYGKECMDHGGTYWIPGCQEKGASMPIPPSGTVTAKCTAHLMWLPGYNADSHDIYFGTDRLSVASANTSSPEFKVQMKMPSNIFDPGKLKQSVSYYWRVDAVAGLSTINGQVWTFECT